MRFLSRLVPSAVSRVDFLTGLSASPPSLKQMIKEQRFKKSAMAPLKGEGKEYAIKKGRDVYWSKHVANENLAQV